MRPTRAGCNGEDMTSKIAYQPDRELVAKVLQATLTDLIELGLLAKHAHWNVTGPRFRNIHLQLDELAAIARDGADDVAERMASIGTSPDGRPASLDGDDTLPRLATGALPDTELVRDLVGILAAIADTLRGSIEAATADPVSQDVLIGVARSLDKQAWMFRAQQAES
jgi:starvation-inducible DNA-binding protein